MYISQVKDFENFRNFHMAVISLDPISDKIKVNEIPWAPKYFTGRC